MNEIDRLHSIPYHLVVLDEMHRLKNPKTKINQAVRRIECPRLIGLTGTLMQNNHDELYCLMDTINPNCVGIFLKRGRNELNHYLVGNSIGI